MKMNRIVKLFNNAFNKMQSRNWDRIYVVVDIHETILYPNYEGISDEYYPKAKEVLQYLSKRDDIILIMWTCSKEADRVIYNEFFKKDNINFNYINDNPEVKGKLTWGDYDTKMYANVLLDDKAGFDAEVDWLELYEEYVRNTI